MFPALYTSDELSVLDGPRAPSLMVGVTVPRPVRYTRDNFTLLCWIAAGVISV